MNVFITGGTGFLGRHLAKRLLEDGCHVSILARNPQKVPEFLSGVKVVHGDLMNDSSYSKTVQNADVVYHCAALTGFWGLKWNDYYNANVLGTTKLLEQCERWKCPNIVHVSTTLLYGPSKKAVLKDEQSPLPEDIFDYERSKIQSEEVAIGFARKGLPLKIVRPTSLYGATGRLIPALVEGMLNKSFRIIGSGKNKKHITHVTDCVNGLIMCAEKGKNGEIYNIGASYIPTMMEIVKTISEELSVGIPPKVPRVTARGIALLMENVSRYKKTTPKLTRYVVDYMSLNHACSVDLARHELGFVSEVNFREGVTSAVQEYMRIK